MALLKSYPWLSVGLIIFVLVWAFALVMLLLKALSVPARSISVKLHFTSLLEVEIKAQTTHPHRVAQKRLAKE